MSPESTEKVDDLEEGRADPSESRVDRFRRVYEEADTEGGGAAHHEDGCRRRKCQGALITEHCLRDGGRVVFNPEKRDGDQFA